MTPLLDIKGFCVSVDDKEIVKGVDLTINEGEVHAVMGPNGSGKSTLVHALMGHPSYKITSGTAKFQGKDILKMEPHERAQAGLFLAFQYPKEIAGVSLRSFLFAAYNAQMPARAERARSGGEARDPKSKQVSPIKFKKYLDEKLELLHMDKALAERSVNQGFSGGEKKKAEILQMHVLNPILSLLDETDSGLDVDALKIVAEGISAMPRSTSSGQGSPKFTALLVTHYARILEYITPDKVHVMVGGKIVESGEGQLAHQLEAEGYRKYGE